MKKRLASLALLLILCLLLALPALADSARELPLVCDASGILTEEQFNVFMNQTVNVPRYPHASYAPARPDSMTRKQKAP